MTAGATHAAPIAPAARGHLPRPLRKLDPGLVPGASDSGQGERTDSRVTVVVITRDRADQLARSLSRLLALEEHPRVIVVDNASRDDTVAMVRRSFPEVSLVALGRNLGAAARNIGCRRASTPYAAFSDDDSWWGAGALRRAADLLDSSPSLALLAARILVGSAETLDPTCALMAESPLDGAPGLPGPRVLGFLACGAVVRRCAFEAAGGFHSRFGLGGEEQLLAVDLAGAGHHVAYVPEVTAHHHPPRRREHSCARHSQTLRNDLWFAWLRRSLPSAVAQTASLGASALRAAPARHALARALLGAPWVLAERRPVSGSLERDLRLLGG
jgi:GT2 family glycosyltransferase